MLSLPWPRLRVVCGDVGAARSPWAGLGHGWWCWVSMGRCGCWAVRCRVLREQTCQCQYTTGGFLGVFPSCTAVRCGGWAGRPFLTICWLHKLPGRVAPLGNGRFLHSERAADFSQTRQPPEAQGPTPAGAQSITGGHPVHRAPFPAGVPKSRVQSWDRPRSPAPSHCSWGGDVVAWGWGGKERSLLERKGGCIPSPQGCPCSPGPAPWGAKPPCSTFPTSPPCVSRRCSAGGSQGTAAVLPLQVLGAAGP